MTRKTPTVYLSGPITGLDYKGASDWRDTMRRALAFIDVDALSPLRGKEFLRGAGIITDDTANEFCADHAMSRDMAVVTRDRWDTTRCDFMLCNLLGATRVSIGTMVELGWADAARVPVILVMEPEGNPHEHAFVRELSGYRVETLDEALDVLAAALAPRRGA